MISRVLFSVTRSNFSYVANNKSVRLYSLQIDKRVILAVTKRFFSNNPKKVETDAMQKNIGFDEFKSKSLKTFEEYKETLEERGYTYDPEKLKKLYDDYCNIKYNQYLTDLSGHNPTHAFDSDPDEKKS